MSQIRCNARRRKQAVNNFNHLAVRQRPNYKQRDLEASIEHNQRLMATEQRIRMGSKKK